MVTTKGWSIDLHRYIHGLQYICIYFASTRSEVNESIKNMYHECIIKSEYLHKKFVWENFKIKEGRKPVE